MLAVWQAARDRLDRFGRARRGRLRLPSLSDHARLTLSSLLDAPLRQQIDLAVLERALIAHGIGGNLDEALQRLGAPPSAALEEKRHARQMRIDAREAAERACADWPEAWAAEWVEWLFRSGQMAGATPAFVEETVDNARRLLDALRQTFEPPARTELAVNLYGSAHALDDSVLLERCTRRALWYLMDKSENPSDGRAVWAAAGVPTDRVSAPVLTWRLPLASNSELGVLTKAATSAGVPLHLSAYAIDRHPPCVSSTGPVLLVENPRLVEAAAERDTPFCVIATNGNPTGSVHRLIRAMLAQGVSVRHHGDFDVAGIAICSRMQAEGCEPWRMASSDYDQALAQAARRNIDLPLARTECSETPWDPTLQDRFNAERRQVHEELLIDQLLNRECWEAG